MLRHAVLKRFLETVKAVGVGCRESLRAKKSEGGFESAGLKFGLSSLAVRRLSRLIYLVPRFELSRANHTRINQNKSHNNMALVRLYQYR